MTESDERLSGRLETKVDMILAEQARAIESRKALYEKLDILDRKADKTEMEVESIDRRLEKVEEPVADFNRWRERGIGALMLITFVSGATGAVIATVGKKVWVAISGS